MADMQTQQRWSIDEICDRYEAAWKAGRRPQVEEFLLGWSGSGEEALFKHLLELDIDYRRRAGEPVVAGDYYPAYARFAAVIDAQLSPGFANTQVHDSTHPQKTRAPIPVLERIGNYEILEILGQGGMGVVFKARQTGLKRLVALKMIRSGDRADPEELRRFRAEAEAAAKLEHPGIVPVYEVGEDQGRLYFSMGLVEGGSLDELVTRNPPNPEEAVRLVEQAARAVGYAHERGVVHRDLKPANVLIDNSGAPRITDFGLAKVMHGDQDLTTTGQVLGTPNYMPPEQARGDSALIGPPSDVYSLGAILYRLLAGRTPFQAATLVDMLHEVVHAEPLAPSRLMRGISPDLDTICLKCLEKTPARRYASATELADELARYLADEPILARPVSQLERSRRWCLRNPLAATLGSIAVAALLIGTAVSAYFGYFATLNAKTARAAEKLAEERRKEQKVAADRATEAKLLAQERERIHRERLVGIYVKQAWDSADRGDWGAALLLHAEAYRLDTEAVEALVRDGAATTPDDNARLDLHRIRVRQSFSHLGPVPVVVAHQDRVEVARFRPGKLASKQFVTKSKDGTARIWDARTGEPIGAVMQHAGPVRCVAFSGDGKVLATGDETGQARTWSADTGEPLSPVISLKRSVSSIALDHSGQRLLAGYGESEATLMDARTGKPLLPPFVESNNDRDQVRHVGFSPDGTKFFTATFGPELHIRSTATGELLLPAIASGGSPNTMVFSPDGAKLLAGFRWGGARLFDLSTGKDVFPKIENPPIGDGLGVWSVDFTEDGSQFVICCRNWAQVFVTATGEREGSPIHVDGAITHVAFSPDDKELLITTEAGVAATYSVRDGQRTSAAFQHDGTVTTGEFSADGKRILTASLDGTARVWSLSQPRPTSTNFALPAAALDSVTSQAGGWLATACQHGDTGTVYFWDLKTGARLPQEFKTKPAVEALFVRPDGKQLIGRSQLTGGNHALLVWDQTESGEWSERQLPRGFCYSVNYADEGRLLLIADYRTLLYDSATLESRLEMTAVFGQCRNLVFNPTTSRALGANEAGTIFLHDVQTGKAALPPWKPAGEIVYLAFSPDGRYAAASGQNSNVYVWDTTTGKQRFPPLKHPRIHWGGRLLAYSPDGRLLATAGEDGVARVWNAATGEPLTPAIPYNTGLKQIAFTANSRLLLIASADQIGAHDARTGLAVVPKTNFKGKILLLPNEREAFVVGASDQVLHWKLPPSEMNHRDALALGQLHSQRQIDNTGSLITLPLADWSRLRKEYQVRFPQLFEAESSATKP